MISTEDKLKDETPHFAKPVLWDSFKNLFGWAFKQQIKNESNSKN